MSTGDGAQGRVVVIGVGHRDRADDGIGPAVVEALSERADVVAIVREGDLAVLPLLWESDDEVVIVDADLSTGPAGELREFDPDELASGARLSTHGLNVADAIELARRLDRVPARLRVMGISGSDFGYGPMSDTLRRRVGPLADELVVILGLSPDACTERPGDTRRRVRG